jgi:hypothetical protein
MLGTLPARSRCLGPRCCMVGAALLLCILGRASLPSVAVLSSPYSAGCRRDCGAWGLLCCIVGSALVPYILQHARLHDIEWLLVMDCPSELPGNSSLRKLLPTPTARAQVTQTLFDVTWAFRVPTAIKHNVWRSRPSSLHHRPGRGRLGLLDYKNETVPMVGRLPARSRCLEPTVPYRGSSAAVLYPVVRQAGRPQRCYLLQVKGRQGCRAMGCIAIA